MFLIPYGTNAPIYYWPYATVALIVANVLVFIVSATSPESVVPYILVFGDGFHPLQWITSTFLHADIYHLLGNMVFLWTFGIIVEGKLGLLKTLAVYLGIGLIEHSIVQAMMLDSQGGALGASGAIFGFMAICLVWAPENEIYCLCGVFYQFIIRVAYFEVKVLTMVGLFLLLQIIVAALTKMSMSSELLHLIGAGAGLPFAIVMLKTGLVDCEHWDLFSIIAGRHTMTDEEREAADSRRSGEQTSGPEELSAEALLDQLRGVIRNGQVPLAIRVHQRLSSRYPGWVLPQSDLWNFIQTLHKQKLWSESIPLMEEYLKHYKQNASLVRLKLGQILLVEKKLPPQALNVLAKIDQSTLSPRQREFLGKLRARAKSKLFNFRPKHIGKPKTGLRPKTSA